MSKPSYEGLIHLLLRSSEKAAGVARVCRRDPHLFQLLVQEKPNSPRFVRDFKTLADVLIQETVRADVSRYFPNLANSIFGEEDSQFVNANGESIRVEVRANVEDTASLLAKVLDGDWMAANALAAEVHSSPNRVPTPGGPSVQEAAQAEACLRGIPLGIWIDPIDSTAEYISGGGTGAISGLNSSGLGCVTVLIGVYRRDTGKPVIGIVNQPFFAVQPDGQWIGQIFYGFCLDDMSLTSLNFATPRTKVIVMSGAENPLLRERLQSAGYHCIETAGAGYKLLAVAIGLCDAYLLSRPTTYAWDTCAPHALLASVGGRVLAYRPLALDGELQELAYERQGLPTCNPYGLVAVRDTSILGDLAEVLQGLEEDQ